MESTHAEPDRDAAGVGGDVVTAAAVAPASPADDVTPLATSLGVWGPSGMGKTQLAASLLADLAYGPTAYVDVDGGRPALAGYEAADLLVYRPATVIADVVKTIREVQAGRCFNRAGQRVRSLIIDAISNLIPNEIQRKGLGAAKPQDQALALLPEFKILFGQLRSLPKDSGITVVQVAHAKHKTVKVGDVSHELLVPDMFPCIAHAWMASVRHLWRVTKKRGAKGPAYPAMMLRTEVEGLYGTQTYCGWMKTSNIAFAQWIAGEMGKREHLEWDTGTLPVDQHPTLASLLRVADDLTFEQGRYGAANPTALRALKALEDVMASAVTDAAT